MSLITIDSFSPNGDIVFSFCLVIYGQKESKTEGQADKK